MPPKSAVCRAALVALVVVSLTANVVLGYYLLTSVKGEKTAEGRLDADVVQAVGTTNRLQVTAGVTNAATVSVVVASPDKPQVQPTEPPQPITPMKLEDCGTGGFSTYDGVHYDFVLSHHVDEAQDISKFVSITPAIPIRVRVENSSWSARGTIRVEAADNERPFVAGANYTVTLKKGVLAQNAEKCLPLAADCVGRFRTPDLDDQLSFATDGTFFRLDRAAWELPLESVNVDSMNARVSKIYPNRLAEYVLMLPQFRARVASDHWWDRSRSISEQETDFVQELGEKKMGIPLIRNKQTYLSLPFNRLGIERRPGAYSLELERGGRYGDKNSDHRLVVLTDLAIAAVQGDHEYVVNVRTLSGNAPVSNAVIRLYSRKLQVLSETTSDANGFARLAYAPLKDKQDKAALIFACRGEDATYLSACDFTRGEERKSNRANFATLAQGADALLFAERGICRPGETIGLFGYLREAGTEIAKGGVPLEMVVRSPSGRLVSCETLTGSAMGFYKTYVKIAPSAPTGEYTFRLRLPGGTTSFGAGTFQVGEYVPDRIKVTAKLTGAAPKPGDPLDIAGRADFYFGTPLATGKYEVAVHESVAAFNPTAWKAFAFGARRADAVERTFKVEGGITQGGFSTRIPMAARADKPVLPVQAAAVITVQPPAGRTVSATLKTRIHYRDFYIGIKDDGAHGRNRRLRLAAVTPQERPAELNPTNYSYVLTRKEWDYRLVKKEGHTTYEWQEVRTDYPTHGLKLSAVADAPGVYAAEIPVPQDGNYEVAVLGASNTVFARTSFWQSAGESGTRSRNPSVMAFELDEERYLPGRVAKVSFDSLVSGVAIVMAGSAAVDATMTCPVKVGRNTIEIPVPATCAVGSYFAGVTVVGDKGSDARAPKRMSGIVRMNVDQEARRLNVKLEVPSVARPNGSATMQVKVTDAQGRPTAAEVQVWAVDRGILALTAWETPDVWKGFFGTANCPYLLNDTYGDLYPDLRVVNGKIGGGDALGGFLIGDKSVLEDPAILKIQTVQVPTSGVAEVTFSRLPRFSGSLMVSAVAADARRAGSDAAELVMCDPLTVEISAPRFAAPGDRFSVGLTCFNHDVPAADGRWSVTTKGLDLQNPQIRGGTLNLALGKNGLVRVPVVVRPDAVELDAAELEAVLQVGEAAVTNRVRLAARSARTVTTRMTNLMVQPGRKVTFTCADAGMASYVRGDVWIGSPSLALVGAVKALDEYPCRCVEQTTSRAFPYLVMESLVARGTFPTSHVETAKGEVRQALGRIASMRLSDGYYSMWPGWDWSWKEASLYVWHFLLEAEQAGYWMDAEVRAQIGHNLRKYVNNRDNPLPVRAYAAYLLAVAKSEQAPEAARALLSEDKLSPYDRFLTGAALIKSNCAREGAAEIKKVWQTPFYLHVKDEKYGDLDSEVRRLGLALWILGDVLPDEAVQSRLSRVLLERRGADGAWGSTQNNAWAALGLARLAGKSSGRAGVRFMTASGVEPILKDGTSVHKPLARGFSFTLDNQDAAPVFVSLRHLGVPRVSENVARGFKLWRRYLKNGNDYRSAVTSCKVGDLITVCIEVTSDADCENVVLTDVLPGGFDIEDDRLATRGYNCVTEPEGRNGESLHFNVRRLERRADRCLAIGDVTKGYGMLKYKIRAVTPGVYAIPDISMDAMYNPELKGLATTTQTFEVTE